jgi:hypothetical protein
MHLRHQARLPELSERPRTPDEIAAYAGALADMLCAWLERMAAR